MYFTIQQSDQVLGMMEHIRVKERDESSVF